MKFKALFSLYRCLVCHRLLSDGSYGVGRRRILAEIGSVDFAGGNVVHISSGVSGLVLAMILGKRSGYGQISVRPHNVPFVVLGAFLLWFGWFGFNAGSALAADGLAVHALMTTNTSAAAGMLSWMLIDGSRRGVRL